MKKIIAMIMTLCMLCPLIPVHAEGEAINSELCPEKVVQLMEGIGVIDDTFAGTEGNIITKGIVADYVAKTLQITDNKAAAAFADTQGYAGVNSLAANGYITGNTAAQYKPQENADFTETLKLMLRLVGYHKLLNYYEGNDSGLRDMAYALDLIDNWNGKSEMTVGQFMTLLYNTIILNPDDRNWATNPRNTSILEAVYGFAKVTGVVTANEYLSLYSDVVPATKGKIRIDDTVYDVEVDANDLIGREVEAYTRTESNGAKAIVSIKACGDEVCYEFTGKAIASASNGSVAFYKNGENGSQTRVRLENPLLIYNHYTDHAAGLRGIKELLEEAAVRQSADITIIKSDKLSRDVIIVEMPEIVNVTSVDLANNIVYGKRLIDEVVIGIPFEPTNETVKGFTDSADYVTARDEQSGEAIDISIVEVGDVLSVEASKTGNVFEIVRLTKRAVGTVTRTTVSGELKGAVINGTEYLIDYAYGLKANIRPNDTASFIIDTYGKIAGAKGDIVNGDPIFAYIYKIVGIYEQDDKVDVYLYNQKGEDIVVNFADHVRLDGVRKDAGAVIDFLRQSTEQLAVIYKLDSEGKINFLDTPGAVTGEDDKLTRVGESGQTRKYTKSANSNYDMGYRNYAATTEDLRLSAEYKDGFFLRTDTVIIERENLTAGDKAFSTPKTNNLPDNNTHYVELYKYDDESPYIEYAVIEKEQSKSFEDNSAIPAMVNSFRYGVSPEGEPCAYVEMIVPNVLYRVYQVPLSGPIDIYINSCHMVINGMDIEKYLGVGDLVRVGGLTTNGQWQVTRSAHALDVIYDYSEDKLNYCWGCAADSERVYYDKEVESYEEYMEFLHGPEAAEKYNYISASNSKDGGRSKGRYAMYDIYDFKQLTNVAFFYVTDIGGTSPTESIIDANTAKTVYFDESRRVAPAYFVYHTDLKTKKVTDKPDRIFAFRKGWDYGEYVYIYKTPTTTDSATSDAVTH